MNNFENNFIVKTFDESTGKLMEKNFLSKIDDKKYVKNLEEKLADLFIIKKYPEFKQKKDAIGLLLEYKRRSPKRYEELREEQAGDIKKFIEERILKNRHKFLSELDIEEQFKIIEKSQPKNSDPNEPVTNFADDLHATIVREMGISYEDLEYYTAVDSHLDFKGVDAFFNFRYKDEKGRNKKIRICIDVTRNSREGKMKQEEDRHLAGGSSLTDLVIYSETEKYNRSEKNDKDLINDSAIKIINLIKEKIKNNKN